MKTFTKGFISIVATTAIVTGLVYAATTINTVTTQTINSGSIMGAGWFQDVNDKLLLPTNAPAISCTWVGEKGVAGNWGDCEDDLYTTCSGGKVVSMRFGC